MSERFYFDDKAVHGRAGIFDRAKGDRLVAFFLPDQDQGDAAAKMAKVCTEALNAAVTRRSQGGDHA